MRLSILAAALVAVASPAMAQHGGGHQPSMQSTPYTGFATRDIKALAPQEIADLRAGRGIGLALAAELNGYPGPMHALEHADALSLTAAQGAELESLMVRMRRDAVAACERLIEAERALDRLFAEREATHQAVAEATARVAVEAASIRAVHLVTHIATRDVLTADQVARYDVLRGYRRGG